ncbi:HD-GYP domain-containing protein [Pseudalkalibacillus caeni]|uniref:HD domain-containing protein n=1 Tax=Exobacillus caeni TaxID=2574798 RepID=A0A5R9EY22_9BACL|nr:HD domain-containing phosphohydrolase [Pseudalkalibacillus caeni]TLS34930.1 HD domain-containing protein [Pseudalkalibacillus caeni]
MKAADQLFEKMTNIHPEYYSFKFHSQRVMHMAEMLGEHVGCYDDDLRTAALLHDIGKTAIADEILSKPERLTDEEYRVIQRHCAIGSAIVEKELGNNRAAGFIEHHHEHWDGSGYPGGLVGKQILKQGRIIAICDAFDTMAFDRRNYQSGVKSFRQAFGELRKWSWKQFDGDLVARFIEKMEKIPFPETELWYNDSQMIEQIFSTKEKCEE